MVEVRYHAHVARLDPKTGIVHIELYDPLRLDERQLAHITIELMGALHAELQRRYWETMGPKRPEVIARN